MTGNQSENIKKEFLDLHPSTKRRIKEHLSEIEYVIWQIKMLLEKAKERKRIEIKMKKIKKHFDKKLKKD